MAKRYLLAMGVVFLMILMTVSAWAVPTSMNYQGRLTNSEGNPLTGTYEMTFFLLDAPNNGTIVWSENHPSVTVADGIYNVQLGSVSNPFSPNLFVLYDELYIEVHIDSETLVPRQPVTSTAFSMKAAVAETVVDGGITTVMIEDGAVDSQKLGNDAVTGTKIADGTVSAVDIDDGSGSGLDADRLDGHDTAYFATASTVTALQSQIDALVALLANVTRPDANTIRFSAVNVQIVNGLGSTDTVNQTGNLIVGYNELRGTGDDRTGSHNIVVGVRQNYSSYGGLVAGDLNTISGVYASVSGGYGNMASGNYASVSGGNENKATGRGASVSGGLRNTASGAEASVTGGFQNEAEGNRASVTGGRDNLASGGDSSINGGTHNIASGGGTNISGGYLNEASGAKSTVIGGRDNISTGDYHSVVGDVGRVYVDSTQVH